MLYFSFFFLHLSYICVQTTLMHLCALAVRSVAAKCSMLCFCIFLTFGFMLHLESHLPACGVNGGGVKDRGRTEDGGEGTTQGRYHKQHPHPSVQAGKGECELQRPGLTCRGSRAPRRSSSSCKLPVSQAGLQRGEEKSSWSGEPDLLISISRRLRRVKEERGDVSRGRRLEEVRCAMCMRCVWMEVSAVYTHHSSPLSPLSSPFIW